MNHLTLISNNCWGQKVYEALNLEYQTPFINTFFHPSDYIELLKRLRYYLSQPLSFVSRSRHDNINELREERKSNYPIALLGGIEMQGLHFTSCQEMEEKWIRRMARMVPDESKWFYKFSDDYGCQPYHVEAFNAMPFERKVFLPGTFQEQTDWKRFDALAWVISG